jgi:hypothetical protein
MSVEFGSPIELRRARELEAYYEKVIAGVMQAYRMPAREGLEARLVGLLMQVHCNAGLRAELDKPKRDLA